MNIILNSWKNSLEVFHKDQFSRFFKVAFKNFFKGVFFIISKFWWLIGLNFIFFIGFKKLVSTCPLIYLKNLEFNYFSLLFFLLSSCIFISTFLISAVSLLSVVKSCLSNDFDFKEGFIKYVKFVFYLTLLSFVIWDLFNWILVPNSPSLGIYFNSFFLFLDLFILFYWIESQLTLIDFFKSLESAVNFIFYNLPFIIILVLLYLSIDSIIGFFFKFELVPPLENINKDNINLLKDYFNNLNLKMYVASQLLKNLFHFFVFIITYLFFINKKDELRYKSFFNSYPESEIEN